MARIPVIAACLFGLGALLLAQTQDRSKPFEDIPPAPAPKAVGPNTIEGVEFRGSRRTPADTLRALIQSKVGEVFKQDTLRLDVATLWDTGRFEDVRVSTETGKKGGIVLRFVVVERPPIR